MTVQTPERFALLCETLYGDAVDPEQVWTEVFKLAPDSADVSTKNGTLRRNIERGSNALGLTAAGMATGAALRDERLASGGKIARALHRTGGRIPAPISRIGGRKGALLAAGALGVQAANMGGDALIAGTLSEKPPKQPVGKGWIVRTEDVDKAFGLPKLDSVVAGSRKVMNRITSAWKPAKIEAAAAPRPRPEGVPKPPTMNKPPQQQMSLPGMPQATSTPKLVPTNGTQGTFPGLEGQPGATPKVKNKVGTALGAASGSRSGQVGVGVGVGGTLAVTGANNKRKQMSSAQIDPYGFNKSAPVDDFTFEGTFSKLDEDKHLAFGWASVTEVKGQPVVDRQGDYITTDEIEKAAYAYVHKSRVGGDMHRRNGEVAHKVSDLVESIVFTDDKIEKMGLPDDFPRGWWVGFKIHDEPTWELVKKGDRTGFSIHGRGARMDYSLDELMGYVA